MFDDEFDVYGSLEWQDTDNECEAEAARLADEAADWESFLREYGEQISAEHHLEQCCEFYEDFRRKLRLKIGRLNHCV